MLRIFQIISQGVLLSALVVLCTVAHPAQITSEQFRRILVDSAGFQPADLTALESGQTIVRLLPVKDKKQVAVCGVVRVQNLPDTSVSAFRESLTQKANTSKMAGGELSSPPDIDDLQTIDLNDGDFEDLKKCVVGNCNVKMSAAMIRRMQTEVDWNSPDYKVHASQLFKRMLVDYAADYLRRGDRALMQYDSRKATVRLADEYRRALSESLFIREFAPEFVQYLTDFPSSELKGVENSLNWSKVTFGLDPIITITHAANYSRDTTDNKVLVSAAKQIYTSRYLDSSLAFTLLASIPTAGGNETYLIFTDLSRSNVLDGAFSDVKLSLVEKEAIKKVTDILDRAKARLEAGPASEAKAISPDETDVLSRVRNFGRHWAIRVLLLLLLGLIFSFLYREWRLYSKQRSKN